MSNHRLLNTHAEARKSAEKQSPNRQKGVGRKRGGIGEAEGKDVRRRWQGSFHNSLDDSGFVGSKSH